MEFFDNATVVRLRSPTNKYLLADKDEETVRQSRDASSPLARWTVERVQGHAHHIRLKSAHGLYLAVTLTDEPVLRGVSGKKVIQAKFTARGLVDNPTVEWEPVGEGLYVKLRCKAGGKFLRGNGGTPFRLNTVSYDQLRGDGAKDGVLWGVDVVEGGVSLLQSVEASCLEDSAAVDVYDESPTPKKSFSLSPFRGFKRDQRRENGSEIDSGSTSPSMASRATSMFAKAFKSSSKGLGDNGSPVKAASSSKTFSMRNAFKRKEEHHSVADAGSPTTLPGESSSSVSNLELFANAKTVRLRSQHNKYLVAKEDDEAVHQGREGTSRSACWNVEFVEGTNMIRLRSCYEKYLTATEEPCLLGMTGKKVLQTSPEKLDSSVQWEVFREGLQVKLKTRYGNFLRANGGPPPWRNTVTHDIPQSTVTQDWILWDIEVIEILPEHDLEPENENYTESEYETDDEVNRTTSTVSDNSLRYLSESGEPAPPPKSSRLEASGSFQNEGRLIYYNVAKNDMDLDEIVEWDSSILFKGKGLEELKEILVKKTGMRDFALCSRNVFNGQLYPIKLQLPPNRTDMHVFLVPSSPES